MIRRAEFEFSGHRFAIINRWTAFRLECDGETVDESEGLVTCELSCDVDGHAVRVDVVMGTMAIANVFVDGEFLRSFRSHVRLDFQKELGLAPRFIRQNRTDRPHSFF